MSWWTDNGLAPSAPMPGTLSGVGAPQAIHGPNGVVDQAMTGATSTTPTAGTAPMTGSQDYGALIQQAATELHLNPQDPTANQQIAAWLQQHGIAASVIQGPNGPSDHKLWINGQAWSDISSQNNQPGTFTIDPYQQVGYDPSMGAIDPKTGMPANPNWSGTPGSAGVGGGDPLTTLRNTPGYQFALQQGLQGIQRSAAARGTLLTGGTLKALQTYGTGLADQTYQNAVTNALNTAWLGQRSASLS